MNERAEEKAPQENLSNEEEIKNTADAGNETLSEPARESLTGANDSVDNDKKPKKRRLPLLIGAGVLLIAAIGGFFYWLYARQFESTDDAFIESDIVQVSPKVSAYVAKVYVRENQQVHRGDLLVELETRDFEARLEQARAQLRAAQAQLNQSQAGVTLTQATTSAGQNQAQSNVETARTNVEQTRLAAEARRSAITQAQSQVRTAQANLAQTRAQIPQAQANLTLAQTQATRYQNLYNNGDIPRQQLDQAIAALRTAQSQLDATRRQVEAAQSRVNEANAGVATAQENYRQSVAQIALTQSQVNESAGRLQQAETAPQQINVSQAQVGTSQAQIEQAQAAVHQAELELSYTKIYAPEDGFVTRKSVQEGQLVQPGTPLMALSQSDEIWVVANFKETQLNLMRVGQPVDIEVDAYPNQEFRGHIDSFQLGTGSRFSVLPAENASGNYVKVVQRIPVKIVFDETPDKAHLLAPGMSVEPTVKVR